MYRDWTTHIILCKHREVEEGSQIGESLDLSATARAQRFRTPQREGSHLYARDTTNIQHSTHQEEIMLDTKTAVYRKTNSPNCRQGESFQT